MSTEALQMSPLQVWIMACRPKTLLIALGPIILGTAIAIAHGAFHFLSMLAALLFGLCMQIGANLANDYFDFKKGADTEKRLGFPRVTQAGLVSEKAICWAMTLVFSLGLLVNCYFIARFSWPMSLLGIVSVVFAIAYTGGPFPFGYHGWGDFFAFTFFGLVACSATYYVQARTLPIDVIISSLAPSALAAAVICINNLRDIPTDILAGKKTLAVRFGAKFARREYVVLFLLAMLVPLVIAVISPEHTPVVLASISVFFAFPLFRRLYTASSAAQLNELLVSTVKFLAIYCLIFSFGWII